ncbi:hypothetical protein [Pedobacter sp. JCM 36344]|uniref:hypothetical protein n=1 Tax=Pedobacter sp. JCM 36344 TaxID=3374280 RepID=UPI00397C30F1
MIEKPSFWQRIGVQDWFLTNNGGAAASKSQPITPNIVFKYIIEKFEESIAELSFAERIVFYHEYIICLNADDFREFMDNKKGILGLIAQESVKNFYEILNQKISEGKKAEPSSNKWVFRFVSHPDYKSGDKGFIGKLLPDNNKKEDNLRVTFIPRQTGMAQTFDINDDILRDFIFYSEGYYEIPYVSTLVFDQAPPARKEAEFLARFETTLPDRAYAGKKVEFLMKKEEIIVTGEEETRIEEHIFKIPSEWVNSPHLKIRYSDADDKFYLASFGEKTIVNESQVERSDIHGPKWTELPLNSRIILNGIIGINIFKS